MKWIQALREKPAVIRRLLMAAVIFPPFVALTNHDAGSGKGSAERSAPAVKGTPETQSKKFTPEKTEKNNKKTYTVKPYS